MKWIRGEEIGHGGSASVNKAIVVLTDDNHQDDNPPLMAVKSCSSRFSTPLKNEKTILEKIGLCPRIIRCFGEEASVESGESIYNLILEFAPRGTLADHIKRSGHGGLSESDIKRHTRAILEGLSVIHAKGFVHCDIKPQNVLLFDDGVAKIADFGVAKEKGNKKQMEKRCMRGTPQYMAPETVNEDEYEAPCDVWALGCVVAEMATGKMAWDHPTGSGIWTLLIRIAGEGELPEIPRELSGEGRDFVGKCLVRDPRKRWTVEMLLKHAFVADVSEKRRGCVDKFVAAVPCCLRCPPLGFRLSSRADNYGALQLVDDDENTDSWEDYGFVESFFLFNFDVQF